MPKIGGAWGAFRLNYEGTELRNVQYELAKLLPAALAALRGKQITREQWAAYTTKLSSLFSLAVIEAAMLSKHKGYIQEDEYRFSTVFKIGRRDDVLYRRRPYSLVKYIEFDWKKQAAESLREIIVGPSADREVDRQFARACLKAYHPNAESVAIRHSEIPCKSIRLQR